MNTSVTPPKGRVKAPRALAQHARLDLDAWVGAQSVELLKALHILTREGQLNQDSRRKLKQVNHLVQLLEGPLRECAESLQAGKGHPLTLVDHGAGKSYLGFILYDRFGADRASGLNADTGKENVLQKSTSSTSASSKSSFALNVFSIESRSELVEKSAQLAKQFGFTGMKFLNVLAQDAGALVEMPKEVDVVTALHACDSLSDDAIEFAVAKNAKLIFLVPCCQAEAATFLKGNRALFLNKTPLAELWRHPLHTRELGSQLTNVMRCLYLEALGYAVTVTELVGWEHSMKNELIVAKFTGQRKKLAAQRLRDLLAQFGLASLLDLRFTRVKETLAS
jgi:Methyltransferase domain